MNLWISSVFECFFFPSSAQNRQRDLLDVRMLCREMTCIPWKIPKVSLYCVFANARWRLNSTCEKWSWGFEAILVIYWHLGHSNDRNEFNNWTQFSRQHWLSSPYKGTICSGCSTSIEAFSSVGYDCINRQAIVSCGLYLWILPFTAHCVSKFPAASAWLHTWKSWHNSDMGHLFGFHYFFFLTGLVIYLNRQIYF